MSDMKRTHILMKTAGRCGSSLVYNYFVQVGYKGYDIWQEMGNDPPANLVQPFQSYRDDNLAVIHDHSIYFLPNDFDKFFGLLIRRKNVFRQALSMHVGSHTNIFHVFTNNTKKNEITDYTKFNNSLTLEKEELLRTIRNILSSDRDRADIFLDNEIPFYTMYYEDFAHDPAYFQRDFGHAARNYKNYNWPMIKTPYQAEQIITNFADLTKWWEDESEKYIKDKFFAHYPDRIIKYRKDIVESAQIADEIKFSKIDQTTELE